MCSIFGYYGPQGNLDLPKLEKIREAAADRGRDGGRMGCFPLAGELVAYLGNWRATPTPEVEKGPLQPYDGLVHNGTIANAEELGCQPGEIDSQVLPRALDRTNATALAASLTRVKGSYAIACHNGSSVLLACNYKPIYYYSPDGGTSFYFSSMERHFAGVLPIGQAPVQVTPYSVLDLGAGKSARLPRQHAKRVVVVCSAGLDSTTAAYKLKSEGWEVVLLHFHYGCKAEARESARILQIAKHLGCSACFLEVPYAKMAGNSTLLTEDDRIGGAIAGAEYAIDWVPARNLVLLSLAIAYSEANGYHAVALGTNLEESGAYADNEEQMTEMLNKTCPYFTQNGYAMEVLAPLGNLMKHEVVKLGLALGVPYELTWSCYRGGEQQCGQCGPCFMRMTAFARNHTVDPTFAHLQSQSA